MEGDVGERKDDRPSRMSPVWITNADCVNRYSGQQHSTRPNNSQTPQKTQSAQRDIEIENEQRQNLVKLLGIIHTYIDQTSTKKNNKIRIQR